MLKDLLDQSLITLNIIASDWEDAVRKASQPLVMEKLNKVISKIWSPA